MSSYAVLAEAERRLASWAESLEEADLARPNPCAGWDVRTLLSHTLTGIERAPYHRGESIQAARKEWAQRDGECRDARA